MNFNVSEVKVKALLEKMSRLGISENDLIEKFIKSSGHGGQKVNKASSCVYLKHSPTGIEVKCQKERSQALNRYYARKILADKIEALIMGTLSEERKQIEKIKRQKRKKSRRAKLKILEEKHKHSIKKNLRSDIQNYEE
ncbi:MAG: peptide chain release factor-like protein [Armatimonadetes bacterium]|nr:peptide chain release factor-like protein [Armatimonadota bacterium]